MTYNGRNEMTQMAMPGSIQEFNVFDADGLLAKHGIRNLTSGTDRFPASLIDSTDIWTNLRGGVDSAFNRAGTLDRRRVRYEGLGQVRVDTMTATGSNVYGFVSATVIEGFNHDPLGNLLSSIEYFSQTGREQASVKTSWAWNGSMSHFDTLAGRLDSVVKINADQRQRFHYDSAGNNWLTRLDANPGGGPPTKYDDRVSYFNTLDQLVGAERRIAGPPDGDVWN